MEINEMLLNLLGFITCIYLGLDYLYFTALIQVSNNRFPFVNYISELFKKANSTH